MASSNPNLQEMLVDLGRALSDAMSDSSDVLSALAKIRKEGYSVQLVLDCKTDEEAGRRVRRNGDKRSQRPTFVINASDLSFLRSVGIDPTRRMRRRRSDS